MKLLLFLVLATFLNAAELSSVPSLVGEATTSVSGASNTTIPVAMTECGSTNHVVWTISATASSAGCSFSLCQSSNLAGVCTVPGDISAWAIPVTSGQTVYFGWLNGGHSLSEVTTNTKLTGDWDLRRYCVSKDAIQ